MDKLIEKLQKNIVNSNSNKSSYWKKYLKEKTNYTNIYNPDIGVGKFKKKNNYYIHQLLLRLIYGNKIFKTETYKKFNSIFIKSGRMMDINTIRHVFTFEILKRYINPKKVCIIGDGGLNAVLGTHLTFPKAKIFSINLSETHIHDYLILKNSNLDLINSVELIEEEYQQINEKKLFLITSNNKNFLNNKEIDLFINIASFQEMSMSEIVNYFSIIKNNKSYLYACNRELKVLPDGEKIFFKNYPWHNCNYLFLEDCNFHKKYYSLNFPFIRKYDGNHKHCLVKFS